MTDVKVQMQQIVPLENLQDVINHKEVVKAIGVLLAAGLLFTPQRSTIFCAYCGEHIVFEPRVGEEGNGTEPVEPRRLPATVEAVAEHRKVCKEYQRQNDILNAVEATVDAGRELALIREAARDTSLSDAAVRVIAGRTRQSHRRRHQVGTVG